MKLQTIQVLISELSLAILLATALTFELDAAQEDPGLTFHLSLNGKVEATTALGSGKPTVNGTVKFADGVFGQALVVGETGSTLTFPS